MFCYFSLIAKMKINFRLPTKTDDFTFKKLINLSYKAMESYIIYYLDNEHKFIYIYYSTSHLELFY